MSNSDYTSEIPYGYCHCGCGQKTKIHQRNDINKNAIKGEPAKFIYCHASRVQYPSFNTRFWSKVNKNGSIPAHCPELGNCWEWTAGRNNAGYGKFNVNGKTKPSHRIAWELENGQIPNELLVLHKCDNPCCVRESHLF